MENWGICELPHGNLVFKAEDPHCFTHILAERRWDHREMAELQDVAADLQLLR